MNPASKLLYILSVFILAIVGFMFTIPAKAEIVSLQEHIDRYCRKDCVSAEQLVEVTARAAKRFNIDKKALMAIIHVESKYHIKAKNGGSAGLTQAVIYYHKPKFLGRNYYAVEDNIFVGAQIYRDCLARMKGSYPRAYSCYNGGGDKNYQSKVKKAFDEISKLRIPKPSMDPLGDLIVSLVK